MKQLQIFSLLCVLGMLFCFVSCDSDTASDDNNSSQSVENATPATPEDTGYRNVQQRDVKNTYRKYFGFENDDYVLGISLPWDLKIEKSDDGESLIQRDNVNVGVLISGTRPLGSGQVELNRQSTKAYGVQVQYSVLANQAETDINKKYFHKFVFRYTSEKTSRVVTMILDYAELNDSLLKRINSTAHIECTLSDSQMGILTLGNSKQGKPILILGNSFIGSSEIGTILQSMCDAGGKDSHSVIAVSIGYAKVSSDFWREYLPQMRNGDYAAVFMCGFYGQADVSALLDYKNACAASNTPLVILPAHNEGYGDDAATKYEDLICLNWKDEIDNLILSGIDKWDFCVDDLHKHSTPLAGYVGAHMIYRAIYGEIPKPGAYGYLADQLGNYAQTGRLRVMRDSQINYLN